MSSNPTLCTQLRSALDHRRPLLLGIILLIGTTGLMTAQSSSHVSQLTVRGSAEVYTEPDLATLRLGVSEQAASAGVAHSAVSSRLGKVLNAIRAQGVEDRWVQTSILSLNPVDSRSRCFRF